MGIFEEIKEGDRIVIEEGGRGYGRIYKTLLFIATVTRVTKTQLTANGIRFSRRDGWEASGRYLRHKARIMIEGSADSYRLMTPEEAEVKNREIKRELDHKVLAYQIRDVKFIELPYETLLKLAEVLGMEAPDDNQA